jgi:hypothetical protein
MSSEKKSFATAQDALQYFADQNAELKARLDGQRLVLLAMFTATKVANPRKRAHLDAILTIASATAAELYAEAPGTKAEVDFIATALKQRAPHKLSVIEGGKDASSTITP